MVSNEVHELIIHKVISGVSPSFFIFASSFSSNGKEMVIIADFQVS